METNRAANFLPEEILSYTLVSKTWRDALLPVCWELYDGEFMHFIPNRVISKYSYLFKVFINCAHKGPFHCNNLRTVETEYRNAPCYQMIKNLQPPISRLCLASKSSKKPRAKLDLSEDSIGNTMKVSSFPATVTNLELRNWQVDSVPDFLKFLSRRPQLSRISLDNIRGIDKFPYSSSVIVPTSSPQPYLIIPNITTLCLDFLREGSRAILEMATCFPNLNRLEIIGSWMPTEEYRVPIHLYCLNLTSLSLNYTQEYGDSNRWNMPTDEDVGNLIEDLTGPHGMGKLRTFEARLLDFEGWSSETLVEQAKDTLEVFKLHIGEMYGDIGISVESSYWAINDILKGCCKLKKVWVRYDYDFPYAHHFEGHWASRDTLEELEIHGGWVGPVLRKFKDVTVNYGGGCTWIWRAGGKICASPELWEIVLAQVKKMPRLWLLRINGVRIFKIKKHRLPRFVIKNI
ncbi:hypothetical protein BGZ80_007559 [Entomortierella chlamydospora]|uniref:F-box domain-containing protein n=1 Tax=Entomortierella chlamydospora TaxID=101097 RepID=A0A9P6N580_9FUNG|nr:hypothetical protein BGZ79_007063 [Entomortierella chlamydospora]KAG0023867.1 hypothetical protein BGZ80_007559 [Entomortierella chlamydospora]